RRFAGQFFADASDVQFQRHRTAHHSRQLYRQASEQQVFNGSGIKRQFRLRIRVGRNQGFYAGAQPFPSVSNQRSDRSQKSQARVITPLIPCHSRARRFDPIIVGERAAPIRQPRRSFDRARSDRGAVFAKQSPQLVFVQTFSFQPLEEESVFFEIGFLAPSSQSS